LTALPHPTRTALATAAALLGFAANSILCRSGLGSGSIDASSFTAIRIASGAGMLLLLVRFGARVQRIRGAGSFLSALALFGYAAAFSLAYSRITAGIGALVLFACVQATMIAGGIRGGVRPTASEWLGIGVALSGLAVLGLPGAGVPDPLGLGLMAAAGVAWGIYSLRGRGSRSPLLSTADNFVLAVPPAILMLAIGFLHSGLHADAHGIGMALASGTLASGLGYSLWYLALPALSATRAAVLQLGVPVIAAAGGILVLGEPMTPRLAIAGLLILGGVGTAVVMRGRPRARA
jgi:drug/metabolite transporter (DMT)-like permease